jgi:hypothetical protein
VPVKHGDPVADVDQRQAWPCGMTLDTDGSRAKED